MGDIPFHLRMHGHVNHVPIHQLMESIDSSKKMLPNCHFQTGKKVCSVRLRVYFKQRKVVASDIRYFAPE